MVTVMNLEYVMQKVHIYDFQVCWLCLSLSIEFLSALCHTYTALSLCSSTSQRMYARAHCAYI